VPHATKPFEFRKLLLGEISKKTDPKRYKRSTDGGLFASSRLGSFVAANAGFVVFFVRRFCGENLSNKTMIVSSAIAHACFLLLCSMSFSGSPASILRSSSTKRRPLPWIGIRIEQLNNGVVRSRTIEHLQTK
jgi:hypothetical protein